MKKIFCLILTFSIMVTFAVMPVKAYSDVQLLERYVSNLPTAPREKCYKSSFNTISDNAEITGLVASRICDLDNDGQKELLTVVIDYVSSQEAGFDREVYGNALEIQVFEVSNDEVVKADEKRINNMLATGLGKFWDVNITILLNDNQIGFVLENTPDDETYTYYGTLSYDGNTMDVTRELFGTYCVGDYPTTIELSENTIRCGSYAVTDSDNVTDSKKLYSSEIHEYNEAASKQKYCDVVNEKMSVFGLNAVGVGYDTNGYYNSSVKYNMDCFICNIDDSCYHDNQNSSIDRKMVININDSSETEISVILNGNKLDFDQPPVIIDGRTLVPLRDIFEALGATVDWDDKTKTVTAKKGNVNLKLTIGSTTLYKNEDEIILEVPAQVIKDKTMIPVRAVAESFDAGVDWNEITKTVFIELYSELEKTVRTYTIDTNYINGIYNEILLLDSDNYEGIIKATNAFLNDQGFANFDKYKSFAQKAIQSKSKYDILTNNDYYCAENFKYYLYNTKKGTVARGLLYTNGWIFNNELTSYFNPLTYVDFQTPGVEKYKSMLLSFMQDTSKQTELEKYIELSKSWVNELYSDMSKPLKTADDIISDKELRELDECNTKAEVNTWLNKKIAHYDSNQKSYVLDLDEKTVLGKALDYSGTTIKVLSNTVDDILALTNVSSNIEMLSLYRDFLEDIAYNGDELPVEMRYAAYDLYTDIDEGYLAPLKNIATHIFDYVGNDMLDLSETIGTNVTDKAFDSLMTKMGIESDATLGEAMAVIEIAAWVDNKLIDMADFVKKEASVEAYADLSDYYVNKLEKAKSDYMENPNYENAEKFKENYEILYNLRKAGENAYAEMFKFKGLLKILTENGYEWKKDAVDKSVEYLQQGKFESVDY